MKEIILFILKGIRMPLNRSELYPGKDYYVGLCETGIEELSKSKNNKEICFGYVEMFKDLRRKRIKYLNGELLVDDVMNALC